MSTPLAEQVAAVNDLALEELAAIWALSSVDEIIAALHDLMPGFIDTWSAASAALAADWYDTLRETDGITGRFTAVIPELGDKGAHELVGWATQPLLQPEPDFEAARVKLDGGAQRRIADSARETIMHSSIEDPKATGWQRKGSGSSCGFCQLLIAKGAVFTEKSAKFGSHDHCNCTVVPAWGGKPLKVNRYTPSAKNISAADKAATKQWVADNYSAEETARLQSKNKNKKAAEAK